jgi:trypsin
MILCLIGQYSQQGDQGGPIIVKGVLVGTISWDIGCYLDPSYAGIYTRITTYVDWIKKTMTNNPG